MQDKATCERCGGTGYIINCEGDKVVCVKCTPGDKCQKCHGYGEYNDVRGFKWPCTECDC